MKRYIEHLPYYLGHLARLLDGKSNGNPKTNGEYKLLCRIFKNVKNPCFIDVGANLGHHSLYFLKIIKSDNYKHYLFEPNIHLIEKLNDSFKTKKSLIYNLAVGEKIKSCFFYYKSDLSDTGQNSLLKHKYLDKKYECKMITLDSFINNERLNNINFLKIDVEGYELNVLKGLKDSLKKEKIDYIQVEYSQQWLEMGGSIKKMLNFLANYNYTLYRIKKKELVKINYYSYLLDDFMYCNFLISKKGLKLPLKLSKLNPLPKGV